VVTRHLANALLALTLGVATILACSGSDDAEPKYYGATLCSESAAGDLFQRRIAPLLADDRPKSCNQCHLSGVDMSMFVRATPCETMACLVDLDLVDLKKPESSKILTWINRADPASPLITEKVIDEEYQGFLEWIEFSAACGKAACGKVSCEPPDKVPVCEVVDEPTLDQALAGEVPNGCSDLEIEKLFSDTVYSSRGRCFPCHFDTEGEQPGNPPRWVHAGGSCNQASLETLRQVEHGGYINIDDPRQSLLLLKPLAEAEGGLVHGGGDKFHTSDDAGYVNFLRFLAKYSECKKYGPAPSASDSGAQDTTDATP
jgi:hypothetical protein